MLGCGMTFLVRGNRRSSMTLSRDPTVASDPFNYVNSPLSGELHYNSHLHQQRGAAFPYFNSRIWSRWTYGTLHSVEGTMSLHLM